MSDGLYYPISNQAWTQEGLVPVSEELVVAFAEALDKATKTKKSIRHGLRLSGVPQFRAFQHSQTVAPSLMGLHRSRVEASGYELVPRKVWNKKLVN
jgi:hypothetical protein